MVELEQLWLVGCWPQMAEPQKEDLVSDTLSILTTLDCLFLFMREIINNQSFSPHLPPNIIITEDTPVQCCFYSIVKASYPLRFMPFA